VDAIERGPRSLISSSASTRFALSVLVCARHALDDGRIKLVVARVGTIKPCDVSGVLVRHDKPAFVAIRRACRSRASGDFH